MTDVEVATLVAGGDREHEDLLDAFHRGIYWDDFAAQHEPLAVWKHALWSGRAAYELTIRIAGRDLRDPARRELLGGIAYERYPRSDCGLVTYMVIAPPARRRGLGRRLQGEAVRALRAAGAPAVFGEVNDPRLPADLAHGASNEPVVDKWRRLERNQAWGARVLDVRYVQPALGPGLARDYGLCLIALSGGEPLPDELPGVRVRDFITELYEITEGNAPARELLAGIPDRVALIVLEH